MIRGFAGYLRTIDPATEIPPTGILIARKRYTIPYLYSDQEIARLLAAAAGLTPRLRAATHYTLIGLLAVSGMGIWEALRLDRDDVDLDAGVLTIRLTKFGKTRQLPLNASTITALARYDQRRDALYPNVRGSDPAGLAPRGVDVQARMLWLSTYMGHYAGHPVKRAVWRRSRCVTTSRRCTGGRCGSTGRSRSV
jgi:integrase